MLGNYFGTGSKRKKQRQLCLLGNAADFSSIPNINQPTHKQDKEPFAFSEPRNWNISFMYRNEKRSEDRFSLARKRLTFPTYSEMTSCIVTTQFAVLYVKSEPQTFSVKLVLHFQMPLFSVCRKLRQTLSRHFLHQNRSILSTIQISVRRKTCFSANWGVISEHPFPSLS